MKRTRESQKHRVVWLLLKENLRENKNTQLDKPKTTVGTTKSWPQSFVVLVLSRLLSLWCPQFVVFFGVHHDNSKHEETEL